jgi:hypothetical protein
MSTEIPFSELPLAKRLEFYTLTGTTPEDFASKQELAAESLSVESVAGQDTVIETKSQSKRKSLQKGATDAP